MDIKKLVLGGVIGGVAYFFAGWLVYGIILKTAIVMPEGFENLRYPEEEFKVSLMAISCIVFGVLLSFLFIKSSVNSAGGGAIMGAVIGALMGLSTGLAMASEYVFGSLNHALVDMAANGLTAAIAGAALGWYLSRK